MDSAGDFEHGFSPGIRTKLESEEFAKRGHQVVLVTRHPIKTRLVQFVAPVEKFPSTLSKLDVHVVLGHFHWVAPHLVKQPHPWVVHLGRVFTKPEFQEERVRRVGGQQLQELIERKASGIVVLNTVQRNVWFDLYGRDDRVTVIPTLPPRTVPSKGKRNPYLNDRRPQVIFCGRFERQRHTDLLNRLGRRLREEGMNLNVIGEESPAWKGKLDRGQVTCRSHVPLDDLWRWIYYADVGIALSGRFGDDLSKVYTYLRAGTPAVIVETVATRWAIQETGCGVLIPLEVAEHFINGIKRARKIPAGVRRKTVEYMRKNATVENAVDKYERLFLWIERRKIRGKP